MTMEIDILCAEGLVEVSCLSCSSVSFHRSSSKSSTSTRDSDSTLAYTAARAIISMFSLTLIRACNIDSGAIAIVDTGRLLVFCPASYFVLGIGRLVQLRG